MVSDVLTGVALMTHRPSLVLVQWLPRISYPLRTAAKKRNSCREINRSFTLGYPDRRLESLYTSRWFNNFLHHLSYPHTNKRGRALLLSSCTLGKLTFQRHIQYARTYIMHCVRSLNVLFANPFKNIKNHIACTFFNTHVFINNNHSEKGIACASAFAKVCK